MMKFIRSLSFNFTRILIFIVPIATVFVIFAPNSLNSNYFELNNKSGNTFHLSLLNDSKYSFEVKFPCNIKPTQNTWLIEFFGGPALRLEIDSQKAYLLLGHNTKNSIKVLTFKRNDNSNRDCFESLIYTSENNKINYSIGSRIISTINISDNYRILINKIIKINPEIRNYLIEFNLNNSSNNPNNNFRVIFLIGIFVLLVLINYTKIIKNIIFFNKIKFKKNVLMLFLFNVVLISLISLPRGDDGWYLMMNKYFRQTQQYDNYVFSSPRPSGFLLNLMQSLLNSSNIIFIFRWIPILLMLIILIQVINAFDKIKNDKEKHDFSTIFISCILVLFFISSLNSLRPEVVISLLYILILNLITTIDKSNFYFKASLLIILIGFGLSTHQQAVILLFASLVLLIQFFIYKPIFTQKSFLFLLVGFSISIQLIFIQGNIFWLKNVIDTFTKAANNASPGRFLNNYPLYAEWIRPYHLYFSGLSTQPQIFLGTLLFIVSLFLIYTSYKLFKINTLKFSNIHFLTISLSLAPFGLFLSPIKWSWYYAPLFLNIIFAYFILNFTNIYQKNFKKVLAQILAIGFSASLAFTYDWRANDFNWPLRFVTSSELNSKYGMIFGSSKSAIIWIVLTIIALVLVYYLKNNSFEIQLKVLNIFTIFLIITLSVIHLSPPVIDAIKNPHEWTFVKQSVVGIWDEKARCGLASTIKDQETGKPIQQLLDENNWTVVSMPAPYIFIPCANPVLTEAGSWLMPDVSFGWVPVYDQQRLATETDIKLMGCDESLQTEDAAQKCFYKWDTKIKNLPPYTTKVVYYPDYGQILEKINPFK